MRTDGGEGGVLGLVAVHRLGATSLQATWHLVSIGRPFISLSVAGSVVVVVFCRGVGVVVWWGSWCIVVRWSSCGEVVVVWSLWSVMVTWQTWVAWSLLVSWPGMEEGGAHHDNITRNNERRHRCHSSFGSHVAHSDMAPSIPFDVATRSLGDVALPCRRCCRGCG